MNETKTINPQRKSPLFSLPLEIREKIYTTSSSVAQEMELACRQARDDFYVVLEPSEVKTKKDIWSTLRAHDLSDVSFPVPEKPLSSKSLYRIGLIKRKANAAHEELKKVGTELLLIRECALNHFIDVTKHAVAQGEKLGFTDTDLIERIKVASEERSAIHQRETAMIMEIWQDDIGADV